MAGPFTWWPNRKSAIGLRNCSKRPYSHSRVFVTQPPIAGSPLGVDKERMLLSRIEQLEGELRKAAARDADGREKMAALVESSDAVLKNAQETQRRCNAIVDASKSEFHELRGKLAAAEKAADPDTIALKVMYGVEAATAHHQRELAEMRGQLAAKDSEIAELKRSKRRLREALDRLSKET